jgi:hypothetical protein
VVRSSAKGQVLGRLTLEDRDLLWWSASERGVRSMHAIRQRAIEVPRCLGTVGLHGEVRQPIAVFFSSKSWINQIWPCTSWTLSARSDLRLTINQDEHDLER